MYFQDIHYEYYFIISQKNIGLVQYSYIKWFIKSNSFMRLKKFLYYIILRGKYMNCETHEILMHSMNVFSPLAMLVSVQS